MVFFGICTFECFLLVPQWHPAERIGFYFINTSDREDRTHSFIFCIREFYWFKHFKIIKMKKIRRCSVEGEILLGEDSSQQNHTLTYSGKGYYWGTFLRVCFFWVCTLNSPEWELRMSVWPGQSRNCADRFAFKSVDLRKKAQRNICLCKPSTFVNTI